MVYIVKHVVGKKTKETFYNYIYNIRIYQVQDEFLVGCQIKGKAYRRFKVFSLEQ